ncbi:MAG TPA: hypothetical protein VKZ67_11780 [Natronosporangium sp.]|nr:hypothetical protein [Natronosporangium sp.]
MRAGRGLAAVVAMVVAMVGLVGCTESKSTTSGDWDDPSVIAYIGDAVAITEAEVDAVIEDVRAEISEEIEQGLAAAEEKLTAEELAERREQRYEQLEQQLAVNRSRTMEMRILTEAVRVWLAANELEEPEPALEYQAGELGLEVDNEYVRVVAEFYAVMSVIQAIAEPVEPSEADQREVYDHLVAEGLTRSSFDDAKQVLTQEVMGHQVAIRDLIVEALALAKVRVNPRFDFVYKVPVPVGSGQSWLEIPLRGPHGEQS